MARAHCFHNGRKIEALVEGERIFGERVAFN
jgi:hypothetical protein